MHHILAFVGMMVVAIGMDYCWIGLLMKGFYTKVFAGFGRLSAQGNFEPVLWAAGLVYILIPLVLLVFVIQPFRDSGLIAVALRGGLLGFCIYGIYDFTNLATIRDWTTQISVIDMAWGTVLCAVVAVVGRSLISFGSPS